MGLQQIPSKGGVPGGNTASRPSSPITGDTYYDGQAGALLIYDGTKWVPCSAPASQPTISIADVGTVDYGTVRASVTFTEGTLGGKANGYTAIQGSTTATSTSNPVTITVSGNPGSYSFTGTSYNAFGTSPVSEAVSQTLTSRPAAPTIGTATGGDRKLTVTFTAGATGGKSITNYQYSVDGGTTYTAFSPAQTTSPLTVSGLTNETAYTVKIKAVNANGAGAASDASNEVTPLPVVITGGTITTTGGYTYHAFTSNGTFSVQGAVLDADILVVAGGGGGASFTGAGGGAGGLLTFTNQTIGAGTKSVVVGSGGSGGPNNWHSIGSSGGNSQFGSLTECIGGGGGRGYNAADGYQGGYGGSGGGGGFISGTPGSGVSGQGYSGGYGSGHSGNYVGGAGGGGGAGGSGGNSPGGGGSSQAGGVGGIGATSALLNAMGAATGYGELSGGNYYFAGGGGGFRDATPGLGGGGHGGTQNSLNTNGTAGTGGGGGGDAGPNNGGNGGSGIVIVRYAEIV